MRASFRETTVSELPTGGRLSCGNFWERPYDTPAGERRGLTAKLAIFEPESSAVVGVGSQVELDGVDWVVDDLVRGGGLSELSLKTLDHRDDPVVVGGVDLAMDAGARAREQLRTGRYGDRDDPSPLEWVEQVYVRVRESHPRIGRQLSRGVGSCFGMNERLDGLVAVWFAGYPAAAGGEVVQYALEEDPERYDTTVKDRTPGRNSPTLRQSLYIAAMRWHGGWRPAPEPLVQAAREEVLTGDGQRLVHVMFQRDADWAERHIDAILSLYPTEASAPLQHLLQRGVSGEDALDRVLPKADAEGRRGLEMVLRMSPDLPDSDRQRLLARLSS